jgi:hypothetical protein
MRFQLANVRPTTTHLPSIQSLGGAERGDRKQESNLLDFQFLPLSFVVHTRPGFGSKEIPTSE